MMRLTFLVLAVLIAFGTGSCRKETQHPDSIIGKWRWVKSVGGIGGFTLTPQSTGNTFRDEFYANSIFKRFENDSLISQDKFSIIKNFNYTPTEKADVLRIGSWSSSIFIRNDSLFMNDLYIDDGFGSTYVRIN